MPLTTQLYPSRGSNSFASMPKPDQAWPSMVVALCSIRSEQAARPVAVWQLVATCAAPAHWAPRRRRPLVFCISQFERFDTRCASTRFDQFEVSVSACDHTLHVHLLTHCRLCRAQFLHMVGFPSLEQRGQVFSISVAVWWRASKRLWWRAISQRTPQLLHHAHQNSTAGAHCSALWCVAEACSARNTASVPCCPRMPQQVRRSYARSKEVTAGPPGGTPGRSACACMTHMHLQHL